MIRPVSILLSVVLFAQEAFGQRPRLPAPPPVLYIFQDIHGNPEAQRSLHDLLSKLSKERKGLRIGVEGAAGPLNFAPFERFPDAQVTRKIGRSFLDDGKIGAPEFLGLTVPGINEVGLEDPALYRQNVEAYRSAQTVQPEMQKKFQAAKKECEAEKKRVFPSDLYRLDQSRLSYNDGKMPLNQYLEILTKETDRGFFMVEAFLAAQNLESRLPFNAVNHERQFLIENMLRRFSALDLRAFQNWTHDVSQRKELSLKTIDELFVWARRAGLNLSTYRQLQDYRQYVALTEAINADHLFSEMRSLEQVVFDAKAAHAPQKVKDLLLYSRQLILIEKLLGFRLTPEEWNEYLIARESPTADSLAMTTHFEDFYILAEKRNEAFLKIIEQHSLGAVVAGGFHTPGLIRLLKERGRSYRVVRPVLTTLNGENDGSAYLSIFAVNNAPLAKLFSKWKLFLVPPIVLGATEPIVETAKSSLPMVFIRAQLEAVAPALREKVREAARVLTSSRDVKTSMSVIVGVVTAWLFRNAIPPCFFIVLAFLPPIAMALSHSGDDAETEVKEALAEWRESGYKNNQKLARLAEKVTGDPAFREAKMFAQLLTMEEIGLFVSGIFTAWQSDPKPTSLEGVMYLIAGINWEYSGDAALEQKKKTLFLATAAEVKKLSDERVELFASVVARNDFLVATFIRSSRIEHGIGESIISVEGIRVGLRDPERGRRIFQAVTAALREPRPTIPQQAFINNGFLTILQIAHEMGFPDQAFEMLEILKSEKSESGTTRPTTHLLLETLRESRRLLKEAVSQDRTNMSVPNAGSYELFWSVLASWKTGFVLDENADQEINEAFKRYLTRAQREPFVLIAPIALGLAQAMLENKLNGGQIVDRMKNDLEQALLVSSETNEQTQQRFHPVYLVLLTYCLLAKLSKKEAEVAAAFHEAWYHAMENLAASFADSGGDPVVANQKLNDCFRFLNELKLFLEPKGYWISTYGLGMAMGDMFSTLDDETIRLRTVHDAEASMQYGPDSIESQVYEHVLPILSHAAEAKQLKTVEKGWAEGVQTFFRNTLAKMIRTDSGPIPYPYPHYVESAREELALDTFVDFFQSQDNVDELKRLIRDDITQAFKLSLDEPGHPTLAELKSAWEFYAKVIGRYEKDARRRQAVFRGVFDGFVAVAKAITEESLSRRGFALQPRNHVWPSLHTASNIDAIGMEVLRLIDHDPHLPSIYSATVASTYVHHQLPPERLAKELREQMRFRLIDDTAESRRRRLTLTIMLDTYRERPQEAERAAKVEDVIDGMIQDEVGVPLARALKDWQRNRQDPQASATIRSLMSGPTFSIEDEDKEGSIMHKTRAAVQRVIQGADLTAEELRQRVDLDYHAQLADPLGEIGSAFADNIERISVLYLNLAEAYAAAGDVARACGVMDGLKPLFQRIYDSYVNNLSGVIDFIDIFERALQIEAKLGRFAEANNYIDKILVKFEDPNELVGMYAFRAHLHRQMGDPETALLAGEEYSLALRWQKLTDLPAPAGDWIEFVEDTLMFVGRLQECQFYRDAENYLRFLADFIDETPRLKSAVGSEPLQRVQGALEEAVLRQGGGSLTEARQQKGGHVLRVKPRKVSASQTALWPGVANIAAESLVVSAVAEKTVKSFLMRHDVPKNGEDAFKAGFNRVFHASYECFTWLLHLLDLNVPARKITLDAYKALEQKLSSVKSGVVVGTRIVSQILLYSSLHQIREIVEEGLEILKKPQNRASFFSLISHVWVQALNAIEEGNWPDEKRFLAAVDGALRILTPDMHQGGLLLAKGRVQEAREKYQAVYRAQPEEPSLNRARFKLANIELLNRAHNIEERFRRSLNLINEMSSDNSGAEIYSLQCEQALAFLSTGKPLTDVVERAEAILSEYRDTEMYFLVYNNLPLFLALLTDHFPSDSPQREHTNRLMNDVAEWIDPVHGQFIEFALALHKAVESGSLAEFLGEIKNDRFKKVNPVNRQMVAFYGEDILARASPENGSSSHLKETALSFVMAAESFLPEEAAAHRVILESMPYRNIQTALADVSKSMLRDFKAQDWHGKTRQLRRLILVASYLGDAEFVPIFQALLRRADVPIEIKKLIEQGNGDSMIAQMKKAMTEEEWTHYVTQMIEGNAAADEVTVENLLVEARQHGFELPVTIVEQSMVVAAARKQKTQVVAELLMQAEQCLARIAIDEATLVLAQIFPRDIASLEPETAAKIEDMKARLATMADVWSDYQAGRDEDVSSKVKALGSGKTANAFRQYVEGVAALEKQYQERIMGPETVRNELKKIGKEHVSDQRRDDLRKRVQGDIERSAKFFKDVKTALGAMDASLTVVERDRDAGLRHSKLDILADLEMTWNWAVELASTALALNGENEELNRFILQTATNLYEKGRTEIDPIPAAHATYEYRTGPAHQRFDHAQNLARVIVKYSLNRGRQEQARQLRAKARPYQVYRDLLRHVRILSTKMEAGEHKIDRDTASAPLDPASASLYFPKADLNSTMTELTVFMVSTKKKEVQAGKVGRAVATVLVDDKIWQTDAPEDLSKAPLMSAPANYQIMWPGKENKPPLRVWARFIGIRDGRIVFKVDPREMEDACGKNQKNAPAGSFRFVEDFMSAAHRSTLQPMLRSLRQTLDTKTPTTGHPFVDQLFGMRTDTAKKITPANVKFVDKEVEDDPDQSALIRDVLSPDLYVAAVQGPPGSGKSRTIEEMTRQFIDRGEIVVITSQSNYALDNIGKRFLRSINGAVRDWIPFLRAAAKDRRIDPEIKPYHENRLERLWNDIHRHNKEKKGFVYLATNNGLIFDVQCFFLLQTYLNGASMSDIDRQYHRWQGIEINGGGKNDKHNGGLWSGIRIQPVIITDEGSQADVAESLLPLIQLNPKKFILIGDHEQLPPHGISNEEIEAGEAEATYYGFKPSGAPLHRAYADEAIKTQRISLLENVYVYSQQWGGVPLYMLTKGRRGKWIHTELFSRLFYKGLLRHRDEGKELERLESDDIVIVDVESRKSEGNQEKNLETRSFRNFYEAAEAVRAVAYFLNKRMPLPEIKIISPYSEQNILIQQTLYTVGVINDSKAHQEVDVDELERAKAIVRQYTQRGLMLNFEADRQISRADIEPVALIETIENDEEPLYLTRIKPQTIDSVQGQEAEAVIISFVRSNPEKNIGFMRLADGFKRLNVSISRVKSKMVMIGDFTTLVAGSRNRNGYSPYEDILGIVSKLYAYYSPSRGLLTGPAFDRVPWKILPRFPQNMNIVKAMAVLCLIFFSPTFLTHLDPRQMMSLTAMCVGVAYYFYRPNRTSSFPEAKSHRVNGLDGDTPANKMEATQKGQTPRKALPVAGNLLIRWNVLPGFLAGLALAIKYAWFGQMSWPMALVVPILAMVVTIIVHEGWHVVWNVGSFGKRPWREQMPMLSKYAIRVFPNSDNIFILMGSSAAFLSAIPMYLFLEHIAMSPESLKIFYLVVIVVNGLAAVPIRYLVGGGMERGITDMDILGQLLYHQILPFMGKKALLVYVKKLGNANVFFLVDQVYKLVEETSPEQLPFKLSELLNWPPEKLMYLRHNIDDGIRWLLWEKASSIRDDESRRNTLKLLKELGLAPADVEDDDDQPQAPTPDALGGVPDAGLTITLLPEEVDDEETSQMVRDTTAEKDRLFIVTSRQEATVRAALDQQKSKGQVKVVVDDAVFTGWQLNTQRFEFVVSQNVMVSAYSGIKLLGPTELNVDPFGFLKGSLFERAWLVLVKNGLATVTRLETLRERINAATVSRKHA